MIDLISRHFSCFLILHEIVYSKNDILSSVFQYFELFFAKNLILTIKMISIASKVSFLYYLEILKNSYKEAFH